MPLLLSWICENARYSKLPLALETTQSFALKRAKNARKRYPGVGPQRTIQLIGLQKSHAKPRTYPLANRSRGCPNGSTTRSQRQFISMAE